MSTSDEISPLLPLSPELLPSQKHNHRRNSFEAGFPLIVSKKLTNVRDSKPALTTCALLHLWIGRNCAVPFTLLMSAIGAGTLSVPLTFVLLSPFQALSILIFVGMAMAFTADTLVGIYVVVAMNNISDWRTNRDSYQFLAWKAGGKLMARLTGALTAFAVFGACVGCICVVKDMAPIMLSALIYNFEQKSLEERQLAVKIAVWAVMLIVLLPLGCLTKISALRFSSYLGVAFSIYLVGAVAYRAATESTENNRSYAVGTSESVTKTVAPLFWRISEVVGIYNFAFMLHLNIIPLFAQLVAAEMARKIKVLNNKLDAFETNKAMVTVLESAQLTMQRHLILAVGSCVLLYAIFGLCAVQIYGHETLGNILLNLSNDAIMEVPRVAILLTILLSFPLLFHPLRSLMLEIYVTCLSSNPHDESFEEVAIAPPRAVQAIVTISLVVAQVICALRVPGIHVVFSFVGSSILLMLCYVFPLIFYIRLIPWRTNRKRMIRLALLIFVCVIATLFCVAATLQVITST
ncbi:amino acid auxin permease family [Plasmopara halstedii]|uniref:Amino acid auxin permease family n=1 Tax=Plasmopara halstedii TaxID=4781 RepID=A0A0P1AER1_PLAHL|nr:amino acid auxin permease family [Plasmopara halstedii]CEG39556.1 amino acid auxin permease family [Plasmopara halstedii]|eukprot:XP_024575925.1 amino acid auxin permease family [Plasmopara halstedii]